MKRAALALAAFGAAAAAAAAGIVVALKQIDDAFDFDLDAPPGPRSTGELVAQAIADRLERANEHQIDVLCDGTRGRFRQALAARYLGFPLSPWIGETA